MSLFGGVGKTISNLSHSAGNLVTKAAPFAAAASAFIPGIGPVLAPAVGAGLGLGGGLLSGDPMNETARHTWQNAGYGALGGLGAIGLGSSGLLGGGQYAASLSGSPGMGALGLGQSFWGGLPAIGAAAGGAGSGIGMGLMGLGSAASALMRQQQAPPSMSFGPSYLPSQVSKPMDTSASSFSASGIPNGYAAQSPNANNYFKLKNPFDATV